MNSNKNGDFESSYTDDSQLYPVDNLQSSIKIEVTDKPIVKFKIKLKLKISSPPTACISPAPCDTLSNICISPITCDTIPNICISPTTCDNISNVCDDMADLSITSPENDHMVEETQLYDNESLENNNSPLIQTEFLENEVVENVVVENVVVENVVVKNVVVENEVVENVVVVETTLEKIERFRKMPHYKQKSKEWLLQRNSYLTASTIYTALGLDDEEKRRDLLLNKVSYGKMKGFNGNCATHWGNKYEQVANNIYVYRRKVVIHEFGMITNTKYPILGVSPDGITESTMVEIKCPYTRVIKKNVVKPEYYHQMQEQMAIAEFDLCDFLECKFEEVTEEIFLDDFYYYDKKTNVNREKGSIICYIDIQNECSLEYIYSPIECYLDLDHLQKWEQQTIDELKADSSKIYLQKTYWQLLIYSNQVVNRDPEWIIDNYPILKAFWAEVEYYRKEGLDKLLKKIEQDKINAENDGNDDENDDESGNKVKGCFL